MGIQDQSCFNIIESKLLFNQVFKLILSQGIVKHGFLD